MGRTFGWSLLLAGCDWARAELLSKLTASAAHKATTLRFKIEIFIRLIITCKTDAKLELSAAAHVLVVVIDRDTIIQTQRPEPRYV